MKCPVCRHKTRVTNSRSNGAFHTFRYRECTKCLTRFKTVEVIEHKSMDDYILSKMEESE